MFETCMVESAGQIRSHNRKWTTAGAFLLEGALVASAIIATMMHTDTLVNSVRMVHFVPTFESQPLQRTELVSGGGGGGTRAFTAPGHIPTTIVRGGSVPDVTLGTRDRVGDPTLPPGIGVGTQAGALPIVDVGRAPVEHRRLVISRMDPAKLVRQVFPVYPQPARFGHISGKVLLHAVIAKDGTIQNLEVLSGHPMLTQAALEAVRQWQYRPTYLGGQPVEVETTITVNFVAQ